MGLSLKGVVVIVEPREHPLLSYSLLTTLKSLPGSWAGHIFHGRKNKALVDKIIKKYEQFDIKLTELQVDDMADVSASYNSLLTSTSFWTDIHKHNLVSHALIIQTDTVICKLNCNTSIDEFFKYDYIGAPWAITENWLERYQLESNVGNGGFSLRNISTIRRILNVHTWDRRTPEDVWFSKIIQSNPIYGRVAPVDVAERFAAESYFRPHISPEVIIVSLLHIS